MTVFSLPARPADAAVCMVNSFRHLLTEEACAVAPGMRRGKPAAGANFDILGLHLLSALTPRRSRSRLADVRRADASEHRSPRGRLRPRRPIETLQVSLWVRRPTRSDTSRQCRFRGRFDLRLDKAAADVQPAE